MAFGKRKAPPPNEDVHIDIGKNKQVSVRAYNGVNLVDIREYYTDKASGELRPGKKGISLTEESWDLIVKNQGKIQKALNKLKGMVDEEDLKDDEESDESANFDEKEDNEDDVKNSSKKRKIEKPDEEESEED